MLPLLLLSFALAEAPQKDKDKTKAEPPARKELFAKENWYKDQKGKEETFTGVLRYKPQKGVGIGRYNPFTLEIEGKDKKKDIREVYVGGKDALLKDYAGKKVTFTGKAVEMEVVGKIHREVWPARVELVKEKDKK
jgi:hypothetical protein